MQEGQDREGAARRLWHGVERRLPRRLQTEIWAWSERRRWGEFDEQAEREGRLPPGESLGYHGLWMAETFAPSQAEGLRRGLADLRVDEYSLGGDEESSHDWVTSSRSGRLGWRRIGTFSRSNGPPGFDTIPANLPAAVDYASLHLFAIAPSLTVITAKFTLNDETQIAVSQALNAHYGKATRRRRRGFSILGPGALRKQAVESLLDHLRAECGRWLARHLRGHFAVEGNYPTCLLATLDIGTPLTAAFDRSHWDSYAAALQFDQARESWERPVWPGLRLLVPDHGNTRNWLLAGRTSQILDDRLQKELYHGSGRFAWMGRIGEEFSALLGVRAADLVLRDYRQQISVMRDRLGSGGSWQKADLGRLRGDLSAVTVDVEPVARELADLHDWVFREVADFQRAPDNAYSEIAVREREAALRVRQKPLPRWNFWRPQPRVERPVEAYSRKSLSKLLEESIKEQASGLVRDAQATREAIVTAASLTSSMRELAIAGSVRWLTIVVLVLTIIQVLLATSDSGGSAPTPATPEPTPSQATTTGHSGGVALN